MKVWKSLLLVVGFLGLAPQLKADEGMWLYNNLPLAQLKEKYGFEPTQQWIEHLQKSSCKVGPGGSGSFVSADGLVLTNHHVAADTISKVSTQQADYLKNGFLAKTKADEIKTPDLEVLQVEEIQDVTARVNSVVKPEMSAAEASAARKAVMALIEKEATEAKKLKAQVVTLYQGGQYHLYLFKRYTDVRLVFAPEQSIAFFGGDADNFEFPRYNLDMTLFRVYENDKPAKIENHLKWSPNGSEEGDLVFVSGNPGSTRRMFTVAALEYLRDFNVPYMVSLLENKEVGLNGYAKKGLEEARRATKGLHSIENSRKVYYGRIAFLQDENFFRRKQLMEDALRSNPKAKDAAAAWTEIQGAQAVMKKIMVRRALLELGHGLDSSIFSVARTLVRLADEDAKPDGKRLKEFRDSERKSLEQALYSSAPIYEDMEEHTLAHSLTFLVSHLKAGDPLIKILLKGKTARERAHELVAGNPLAKPEARRLLASQGKKGILSSYNPMVQLARELDPASRAVRKIYEEQVEEVERQAYSKIAKALFAINGTSVYPDATLTLRLSIGQVKGYEFNGKKVAPYTTVAQAYEHEVNHGAVDPFKLPESWMKGKDKMDLSTPFNLVSTNDIIGGNSGSPMVNREGELVGLIFDGNIHSLSADYLYEDKLTRAVSVDSRVMIEALLKVYGAAHLVEELRQ